MPCGATMCSAPLNREICQSYHLEIITGQLLPETMLIRNAPAARVAPRDVDALEGAGGDLDCTRNPPDHLDRSRVGHLSLMNIIFDLVRKPIDLALGS